MIYLIIAVLCSAMFSTIFRICQKKGIDCDIVILINYLVACIAAWIPLLIGGDAECCPPGSAPGIREWLLGAFQGLLFVNSFIWMEKSTSLTGVAVTTVSARASLVIPVLLGWILLGAGLSRWYTIPMILVAMALIILPSGEAVGANNKGRVKGMIALVCVFLSYGVSDFCLKLVQNKASEGFDGDVARYRKDFLMGTLFLFATLFSLLNCLRKSSFSKGGLNLRSLLGGAALGGANLICTACILKSLSMMSTTLFYPLYNIGIVIMASVIGLVAFKEKLGRLQIAGIVLSVAAIFLATV